MNYTNAKKGFKLLFIAEMLLIAGSVSDVFNETQLIWLSLITIAINFVAFLINLKGLKLMAKDDEGYKKAQTSTVAGIIITVVTAILAAVFENKEIGKIATIICDDASSIAEYITACFVMKTSIDVMNKAGKYEFADKIGKTLSIYNTAYCICIILDMISDFNLESVKMIFAAVGIVGVVIAIISQIKYYIFLKDMSNELQKQIINQT